MGKSRTFSKERRMVSLHSLLLKTIFRRKDGVLYSQTSYFSSHGKAMPF